ncbi:hypothetical protein BCR34DRAFT_576786 [Clohesyomyces aquaticus]|uniref:Uncharacterized protein n=1 Tax=Clohesyomyces aquaticus TaxID=1231657 RepID=A0A1Y1YM05_9PLEO|nr:hypothetical protein BCR34DRAFT_576786 [Clohesyomyces aquaticus]
MNDLAWIWHGADRYADAASLLQDCIVLGIKYLGKEDSFVQESLSQLNGWLPPDEQLEFE